MRICAATPGAGSSAGENEYQPENTGYAGRVPYFFGRFTAGRGDPERRRPSRRSRPIGANGAGKTTTLHAIAGLLRSASGSITLDGTDLQSVPANSIIRMGLAHVPEGRQLAGTLSGGEQQMLATGRALMTNPRIVLMDEPSMGLSPLLVKEIFAIIEELHKSGITILLVEQDAKMTLAVSDRAYVLETGTISMEGAASELAEDDRVRKAYLGA